MARLKNPRHELFVQELIKKGGHQMQAYLAIYPDTTPESARHSSSVLLTKVDIRLRVSELLEANALGVAELIHKLKDLVEAKKSFNYWNGITLVSDNRTRLEAIKMLLRLHGLLGDKSDLAEVYLSSEQLERLAKEQELSDQKKQDNL